MSKSSVLLLLVFWGQISSFIKISKFEQFLGREFFVYKLDPKMVMAKGHKKTFSTAAKKSPSVIVSGLKKRSKNLSKIISDFDWFTILQNRVLWLQNSSFFDFNKVRLMLFGCCMASLLS